METKKMNSLPFQVNENMKNIETLNSDITLVNNRIDNVNASIDTINGDIVNINNNMNTKLERVWTLDVNAIQSSIDNIYNEAKNDEEGYDFIYNQKGKINLIIETPMGSIGMTLYPNVTYADFGSGLNGIRNFSNSILILLSLGGSTPNNLLSVTVEGNLNNLGVKTVTYYISIINIKP